MRRWVIPILIFCAIAQAGNKTNWKGYLDTCSIVDTLEADTIKYGTPFDLTEGTNMVWMLGAKVDSIAGFALDSMEFDWGYQVGYIVLNGSDAQDTMWGPRVKLDTYDADSLGKVHTATHTSDNTYTVVWGDIDTLTVTGYATQVRDFSPPWGVMIRPWAKGNANGSSRDKTLRFTQLRGGALTVRLW